TRGPGSRWRADPRPVRSRTRPLPRTILWRVKLPAPRSLFDRLPPLFATFCPGIDSLKQQLEQLLLTALRGLPAGTLPEPPEPTAISVERTRDPKHGDFATNVALRLAKPARRNPRELAQAILAALPPNALVARTEVAGAGFINFFVTA